jgi:hypothetical protein
MESYNTQTNKKTIIKEYINEFSKILDSRIAEINKKLEEDKIELLQNYEKCLNESELFNTIYSTVKISDYQFDNLLDIQTIQKLKELKSNLDKSLSGYESIFKISNRYKGNLSDMIRIKENEINFKPINIIRAGPSECFWNKTQYKNNFKLEDEDKTMIVKYSGCYEAYTSETFFEDGVHKVVLDAYCIRTTEWHSIGLVNENYNSSVCSCMKNGCFFMIKRDGTCFNGGVIGNTGYHFPDRVEQPYRFEFEINLENESNKFWNLYVEEYVFGPFKLIGQKFRIAAGNCNGGEVKYVLNP